MKDACVFMCVCVYVRVRACVRVFECMRADGSVDACRMSVVCACVSMYIYCLYPCAIDCTVYWICFNLFPFYRPV